ncbi:MAG: TetR/AcrR family transcriptional regulator [Syntrophales bacterium]|nr:TetR/AcrR family transcriptional regulator [Syntrophales bacterium]
MKGKKREKILNSAKQMFGRYGIRKTSLNEIAGMARVAKATIYNYFGSKEQVYLEVLNEEVNDLMTKISEAIAQIKSPLEKLRVFYRTRFNQMREPSYILNLSRDSGDHLIVRSTGVREHLLKKDISILQSILEEGVREGIFRMDNVFQTARVLRYALKGMESDFRLERNNDEVERAFEELFDILCRGILVEKRGGG